MKCFAGSGGHNSIVQGANSVYGKEHVEDRRFLDAVAKYVQAAGWKFVNCSDEVGTTKTAVWSNAANNHLRVKDSDVDLQFHLNASPGGTGCEVWLHPSYGNRELAAKISKAMADAFGLKDRGIKFSTELGWINKTKTGLLPEICFIDNEDDMKKFHANFDKAAKGVAEAIVGQEIACQSTAREENFSSNQAEESWTNKNNPYDGSYGTVEAVGGGVNTYTSPYADGQYVQTIQPGTPYRVYGEKDGYYAIGGNQWINKKYVKFTQYIAVVTPVGNVNVFDVPSWNAGYKGEIQAGVGYTVYGEKDGWYLLGGNVWVDGQYVMIK